MTSHATTLAIILTAVTYAAAADEPPAGTEPAEAISEGLPIDDGFVIYQGEYLPCPYVVGTRGEELFINDRPINTKRLVVRRHGFRPYHRGWRPRPGTDRASGIPTDPESEIPSFRPWQFNYAAYVERQLHNGGLLIVFEDDMATFVPTGCEVAVLETLLTEQPADQKAKKLMEAETRRIESARWLQLAGTFRPTKQLAERVEQLAEKRTAAYQRATTKVGLSGFTLYGISVLGIVLGVVALGNLLNHRPKGKAPWRDLNVSEDSIILVVRNVVLVAVLSFFDLGCTLLAQGSAGFVEVNPLGRELLGNPAMLVAFKVTSLLIGCVILLALRRYRGAQVASWWLCLVCTILTFRWATYGSMLAA